MSDRVEYSRLVPESLQRQLQTYGELLGNTYKTEVSVQALQYTSAYVGNILRSRNLRAIEVQSDEVERAAKIANNLYSAPPLQILCIDGRVVPVLVGGFSAGIGGALRLPGGEVKEVVRDYLDPSGIYKIIPGSNLDNMFDQAFEKYDRINEILDSHIGCAAKKTDEMARGRSLSDDGLLKDVKRKKQIAQAMIKHVESKYQGTKQVTPIQFSFDPHNGFGYMGLETDEALTFAESAKGFNSEVLTSLTQSGKILSTQALVFDPKIQEVFMKNVFPIDWKNEYAQSADHFWTNISTMHAELIPYLKQKIKHIYKDTITEEELSDRALLLLSNAYSGFLHNYEQQYAYKEHVEEGINVSVGAYGPFDMPFFAVHNHDVDNLPGTVAFAATIVRGNRTSDRIAKPALFEKKSDFIEAPVVTMVAETLRLEDVSLDHITNMDFSDLPYVNWYNMTDSEFSTYLTTKQKDISFIEYDLLNDLRKKMIRLYTSRVSTADQLLEGNLIAFPVITGKNREIKAIIPFFMKGY